MTQDIRRELISKNLGIKPINHGQVYAFQIAIPDSRKQPVSLEKRQVIEQSLLAHQSNLISLIIRRTDAYSDEDIEYELVYGADWLQIAQDLEVEKVWAWVFDMTDEQAIAAIAEMESLTGGSQDIQPAATNSDSTGSDIATLIDKKLQLATDSIKNSITPILNAIRNDLDEKLKVLNYRMDNISSGDNSADALSTILKSLEAIQQQLSSSRRESKIERVENPINLLEASDEEIEVALKQVDTQDKEIKAAIAAVQYWKKKSNQGLTWKNLEISARAKTGSQSKIAGFAEKTHQRLRAVADIPEEHQANLT